MNPPESDNTRGLGAGMIIAGWIAAIALFALLFNGWFERSRNPNDDPIVRTGPGGTTEVELIANRAGHYVTTGAINGVEALFVVDTGASFIAIPGELARRFGLRRGRAITMQTANGQARGYQTTLDLVEVGGIRQRNVDAVISPGYDGDEILLGMSFLRHLQLEHGGNRLILRVPPS